MANLKATEEFFQAKGLSRQAIIERIKDGRIKGLVDEKTIWVDESEWPDFLLPKNPNTPTSPKDMIVAETEKIKAETARIEAQIKLEEATNKRDRPEKLNQKEQTLTAKEQELNQREEKQKETQILLDAKEQALKVRESQCIMVEKSLEEKKILCDKECQDKLDLKDAEILKRQEELDGVEREIAKQHKTLDYLLKIISTYPDAVKPLVDELNSLIKVAKVNAERQYFASRNTSGKIADYHQNRANRLWGIEDGFKKLLKSFGLS